MPIRKPISQNWEILGLVMNSGSSRYATSLVRYPMKGHGHWHSKGIHCVFRYLQITC
jgi:hypothetical protein